MNTTTKERTQERVAQAASIQGAVANVGDAMSDRPKLLAALNKRGLDVDQFRVLSETIWPGAKSPTSIIMAVDYCNARKLDPMKRPVHIVPMWSTKHGKMVETIWPGISETRTTAHRTGQYVGCSRPEWGPIIEREFVAHDKQGRETERVKLTFPEWCAITVKRRHPSGYIEEYTAEVWWEEAYATESRWSEVPNEMWRGRARGQLAKCTEAAALRMAFPEELGNEYTAEEMAGRVLNDVMGGKPDDIIDAPPPPKRSDFTESPDRNNAEDVDGHEEDHASVALSDDPGRINEDGEPENAHASAASEPSDAAGNDVPPAQEGCDQATLQAYIRAAKQWDSAKALNNWFNTTFKAEAEKFGLTEDQIAAVAIARDARLRELTRAPA